MDVIKYEISNKIKSEEKLKTYEELVLYQEKLLTLEEILRIFYFEDEYKSYIKNKKLKHANTKKNIIKELERFYEFVEIEKIGRKSYYKLSGLYPKEFLPMEKEISIKSKEDLRASLEAIVLYALKNKRVTSTDMTTNEWLVHLGLITRQVLNDYKRFQNGKHSKVTVDKMFDEIGISDYHYDYVLKCERYLNNKEKLAILEVYFNIVDMLRDTFNNTLKHLDSNKLIIHNPNVYYGTKMKAVIGEDNVVTYEKDELVRLELEEINAYLKLENQIKTKLGIETNRKYFLNRKFMNEINKELKKGLNVTLYNGEQLSNIYSNIYKQRAILNKFTNKQLQNYFKKNKDVKEKYDLLSDELLDHYKGNILVKLSNTYDKTAQKNIKYYEKEKSIKINRVLDCKERGLIIGKEENFINNLKTGYDNLIQLQGFYSEIGKESLTGMKERHLNLDIDYII